MITRRRQPPPAVAGAGGRCCRCRHSLLPLAAAVCSGQLQLGSLAPLGSLDCPPSELLSSAAHPPCPPAAAAPSSLPPSLLPPFCPPAVVDNLPSVGPEKYDKLTAILSKIFSGTGRIREGGLFHPQAEDDGNMSKGYAFVEFENAEQARAAQVLGCRLLQTAADCCGQDRLGRGWAAGLTGWMAGRRQAADGAAV